MIIFTVAVLSSVVATASPANVAAFPHELPPDCITSSSPAPITEGQPVRMPGGDVATLEGRQACDSYGNIATITGGVLGPVTSYLSSVPVAPASTIPAPPASDISGVIIGCSILGGFVTLFAGGVFLAVKHSYRLAPDPSVTWAGPPLLMPGTSQPPSVRDHLEGMYQSSPGMHPQSPGETGLRPNLRPPSRPVETSQRRPLETVETAHGDWDDWGEPNEDERFDIAGMSLTEFKTKHDPHGGDFQLDNLAYPDMQSVAQRRLFDYVKQYGCVNPRCAVWAVFGLTHKSGDSPSAKEYQRAAQWIREQFRDENFMPF